GSANGASCELRPRAYRKRREAIERSQCFDRPRWTLFARASAVAAAAGAARGMSLDDRRGARTTLAVAAVDATDRVPRADEGRKSFARGGAGLRLRGCALGLRGA